jgi:hypothetical protein
MVSNELLWVVYISSNTRAHHMNQVYNGIKYIAVIIKSHIKELYNLPLV